ncbi:MAG: N-methyl-L-tryptophan oxidase [Mariniblastus sp.]|nr:N-methyl-L-tryptophan oxidase [Mariniblastus sp.]
MKFLPTRIRFHQNTFDQRMNAVVYDCIVLGLGGLGSASLCAAARQGWNTLGIEQFGVVHDRGSSHGQTRIIRTAYFEHPDYVPLAQRSWDAWTELQRESGEWLVQKTGLLQVGPPEGEVVQGVLGSARKHDLPVDVFTPEELVAKYPALQPNPDHIGVFEASAGFLRVETCVTTLLKLARLAGATIQANTEVLSFSVDRQGLISVETTRGKLQTERLMVTAGPWTQQVLADCDFHFDVIRKQQQWFQIDRVDIKYENGFPCFLFETADGCFYGFPELDRLGMKLAEHSGGQAVLDPSSLDRQVDPHDQTRCEQFLDEHFHFTKRRLVHQSACMYTMSPDGHFVIDRHPRFDNIVLAAGMSGHGFKFLPVVGQQLVRLLQGENDPSFRFLQIGDRRC